MSNTQSTWFWSSKSRGFQRGVYILMRNHQSVPGGELFDFVSTNKTIDEDKTRFIFWQLFTGLKVTGCNP